MFVCLHHYDQQKFLRGIKGIFNKVGLAIGF
jgi:hypothetical protein